MYEHKYFMFLQTSKLFHATIILRHFILSTDIDFINYMQSVDSIVIKKLYYIKIKFENNEVYNIFLSIEA